MIHVYIHNDFFLRHGDLHFSNYFKGLKKRKVQLGEVSMSETAITSENMGLLYLVCLGERTLVP